MKKILFISAVAALALAACTKDTVKEQNVGANAIGFYTLSENPVTRLALTNDDLNKSTFRDTAIAVKGYAATRSSDATPYTDVTLRYSTAAEGWDYSPKAYWPTTASNTLEFFAVWPKTEFSVDAEGKVTIDKVTINADYVAKQRDVMVAYQGGTLDTSNGKYPGINYNNNTPPANKVELDFQHVLSQIEFDAKVVSENMTVYIKSIKLVNLKNSGKLVYDAHKTSGTTDAATWTTSTPTSYVSNKVVNADSTRAIVSTVEDPSKSATKLDSTLLVIPQLLTAATVPTSGSFTNNSGNNSYLEIEALIINAGEIVLGSNGLSLNTDKTVTIPTSSTNSAFAKCYIPFDPKVNGWKAGYKYIYTLNFGGVYKNDGSKLLNPIEYTVKAIANWGGAGDTVDIQAY